MTHEAQLSRRKFNAGLAALGAATALPKPALAQAKTIKIGMPTILSGRVAQLGTSSRNAVMLEVEKVNAAGGLAGRQIEMVIRDSKGQPQEAARVARELDAIRQDVEESRGARDARYIRRTIAAQRALEVTGREVYTGAIRHLSPLAGLETNVAIRTV